MRTLFFIFFLSIFIGNVHAQCDHMYFTEKEFEEGTTVSKDISNSVDYYDPDTAQEIRRYESRSGNDFNLFRYRYYLEDDQDGVGYEQRGCYIHGGYDHYGDSIYD